MERRPEVGSALMARRLGVRDGVLVLALCLVLASVGVSSMFEVQLRPLASV